jgi:hypothetical protein
VSTTIVIRIEDDDLPAGDAHQAVIVALDLAGFRTWTSYIAQDGAPLPDPVIEPPGWPW